MRSRSGRSPIGHDIRFSDVRSGYDGETDVLDAIDLEIGEGTTTAIVGLSGAGKTTLLRLAGRFYDVASGSVQIGGVDVRDVDTAALLDRVAPVFQHAYLFDDTIEASTASAR